MEITKLILEWIAEHYWIVFFSGVGIAQGLGRIGSTHVTVKVNRKKEGA
jgi:hypothetical protein